MAPLDDVVSLVCTGSYGWGEGAVGRDEDNVTRGANSYAALVAARMALGAHVMPSPTAPGHIHSSGGVNGGDGSGGVGGMDIGVVGPRHGGDNFEQPQPHPYPHQGAVQGRDQRQDLRHVRSRTAGLRYGCDDDERDTPHRGSAVDAHEPHHHSLSLEHSLESMGEGGGEGEGSSWYLAAGSQPLGTSSHLSHLAQRLSLNSEIFRTGLDTDLSHLSHLSHASSALQLSADEHNMWIRGAQGGAGRPPSLSSTYPHHLPYHSFPSLG